MQTLEELKAHIPTRKNESYKYTNLKPAFETFTSFDFSKNQFDVESLRVEGAINIFLLSGELSDKSDESPFDYQQKREDIQSEVFKDDFLYKANQINKVSHSFTLGKNVDITKKVYLFHIVSNSDTHIFKQESFIKKSEN
jgi:hypothetical protein